MPNNCIFYVEDDPNDVFFLKHAFAAANIVNPLQIVSDGQAAIDYLADPAKLPRPCLVLLDLKLPRKSGLEVLAWIKAHPKLRLLPVIIFSASAQSGDIEQAMLLGANAFVVKPLSVEERRAFAECVKLFWLHFHQCLI